jgi:tripartite-type tricarboxylate transporter receptor subunit TctC
MIDRRLLLGSTLAMPFIRPAAAQANWPDRPIRMIVGFAAGGGTDITTRTLTPKMSEMLGQPIVVENRPGASGNVATEWVVRAAPDGYTFMMGTIAALAINPTLFPNLPFNPSTDLTPISMSGNILNILVCPADRPWRTVADLVAAAKAQPDTLTYGSSGIGGSGHLGGALFDQLAGVKTIHVPYRGGGPLSNDLAGGKVDFAFATASSTLPLVEGGRIRLLAVPTAQRTPLLPNTPTVAETIPGYELANWNAVVGPKGLPAPIVARMNAAVRAALSDPAQAASLVKHGVEPTPSSPEELAKFIREETAKWAPIVRATGATAN